MLAALSGVLTLACTSANTAPEPDWVELSSSHPTATVPAPKTDNAGRVRVQIRALHNPGLQGTAIRVALSNPDGSQTDLGAVSPYPVDRAGDLHVKLTPDAARRLAERDGRFVLTLVTADPSQALRADIHLTLTATPEAG
jgi:hypothetical protein